MLKLDFSRGQVTGFVLGIIVSAGCLFLIFRKVDLAEVGRVLEGIDGRLLGAALAAALLNYVLLAARWQVLFHPHHTPRFVHLFGAQVVGQFVNTTLPGRLSPVARMGWLSLKTGIPVPFTLSTVVTEKVLDGIVYSCVLVTVLASVRLPEWVRDAGLMTGILSAVVAGLVFALAVTKLRLIETVNRLVERLPRVRHLWVTSFLQSAVDAVDVWRSPVRGMWLAALSWAIWGCTAALNYVTLQALGLHVPFTAAVVVLIFVQAGLRLPSSPGSVGVFHYLCILALSLFGVGREAALGYAIVLHLLNTLPQSLLGVVFVWQARDQVGVALSRRGWLASEGPVDRSAVP